MNKIKLLPILIGILCLGTILVLWQINSNLRDQIRSKDELYEASLDTITKYRNKYNQEVSKIEVLQSEHSTMFLSLQFKDKEITRLQDVVRRAEKEKKDVNTALIIANTTIITLQDSLRNLIIGYTPDPIDTTIKYPIYKREFKDNWKQGTIVMGRDTLDLQQKIKNDYDVVIGYERVALFKHKGYAEITNLNPDTETDALRVYQNVEPNTNGVKWFTAGVLTYGVVKLVINMFK